MATQITKHLKFLTAALALLSAACVSSTDIPSLTGPSELALSFFVSATPDSITQDGRSQSLITVTARDENGRPKPGVIFRLDMFVGGVAADYGTLSGKTVVTGTDGKATAAYTAPNAVVSGGNVGLCSPSVGSPALPGTCVMITATPISDNFAGGVNAQSVFIHLVPLGVILPPADTPTAAFFVTPTPVNANISTNFDGSGSCGGPIVSGVCSSGNVVVSYAWGFGDGASATGKAVQHTYSAAGTYSVVLTVTNDGGKSASTTQTVVVGTSAAPTADFTFSPAAPVIGDTVRFNASLSKAASGRTLTSFAWNFGDGVGGNGQFFDHIYATAATYQVTLTVTDDAGQSTTITRGVTVGSGNPTAAFNTIVTNAVTHTIQADGSASTSTAGSSISSYAYNWGDGSAVVVVPAPGGAVQSHTYAVANTYTVRLTVTDSLGRTGSVQQSVTVP